MEKIINNLHITFGLDKVTGQVTAAIPALNYVSSFGKNISEATARVKEAALGYLETKRKLGHKLPKAFAHLDRFDLKIKTPVPK